MIWKILLNSLRKSSAVTLVEVMISLGLSSFLAVGVSVFLSRHSHFFDDIKAHQQMRVIARQIEQTLQDPNLLAASTRNAYPIAGPFPAAVIADGNMALKNCIDGTGCIETNPERQKTFNLVIPFRVGEDPTDPVIAARHLLAGDGRNVQYRLRDGIRCTPSDVACDLTATAYFWASCPPVDQSTTLLNDSSGSAASSSTSASPIPTNCPRAQTINVRFQIVYRPFDARRKMTVQNYPTDEVFWNGTSTTPFGANSIAASSIPQEFYSTTPSAFSPFIAPPSAQCPIANETLVSIENGQPICKCLFPFKPVPSTGTPTACIQPSPCSDPKTRYRGVDAAGDPICKPVCCQNVRTSWPSDGAGMTRILGHLGIPIPDLSWVPIIRSVVQLPSGGETGCKRGGWIQSITPIENKYEPIQMTSDLNSSCVASNCYEIPVIHLLVCPANPVICEEKIECCYEYEPGQQCPADP